MENVTSVVVNDTASNYSVNQSVGGDELFTATASPSSNLHHLYKTLFIARMPVAAVLVTVMLISNALTLRAVWITPRLRVKAYALTTSMTASNVVLSISLIGLLVHDIFGPMPCDLKLYKAAVRPVGRCMMYVAYVHVSVIAVDRYIAVVHSLQYENRVTQRHIQPCCFNKT